MADAATKMTPDVQEKLEQLAHIRQCERLLRYCRRSENDAKSQYDAAKKQTALAQERLNTASGPNEELELFEAASRTGESAEPDAWRKVSIDEFGVYGVAEGTLSLIKQADIETFGDYQAFCKKHPDGPREINGSGQGKADGIADAWLKFFTDHPEYCAPTNDAESDGDEPFNSQCGFTDKRENFTFSDDGTSYTCPHCKVEFTVDDDGDDDG